MEFKEQTKPIIQGLRKGDINEIMTRSGLSRETVRVSLRLETLVNATSNQIKVWETAVSLLKERQEDAKKAEVKIARIAETLQ